MWSFLQSTWTFLLSLLLPVGRGLKSVGRPLRWVLHFLLLGLVLVGLYFLNGILHIDELIREPVSVKNHWQWIFFLLIYVMGWLIWWLIHIPEEASHYPDIDDAWDEAVRALVQAGVNLSDSALFIVLGRPEAAEEHLFGAAHLSLIVTQAPPGARPLHVYASRHEKRGTSIFVTCPGASLLARQAVLLALEEFPDLPAPDGDNFDPTRSTAAIDKTLRPGEKEKEINLVLRRGAGQVTALDRRAMRRQAGLRMPEVQPSELEELPRRLAHLCRLIDRDRPFCPLNGILVLIPLGGADTEADAGRTGDLASRDLATLRRMLKTNCPVLSMVCDLEGVTGFTEFVQQMEPKQRKRRLGQRFPFLPNLDETDYVDKVRESVDFACTSLLPQWAVQLYKLEVPESQPQSAAVQNGKIFLMLDEMRCRSLWLARIASRIARESQGLYHGCYVAGTGANKDKEQGFVAGVFELLVDKQSLVSWTDEALVEDVKHNRVATIGYILIGILLIGLAALAIGWRVIR